MEVCVSQRSPQGIWTKQLPDWDGPSTLVQLFGPSSLLEDSTPIEEIEKLFPNSVVVGCSGAGVLADDHITDSDVIVAVTRFREVKVTVAYNQITEDDVGSESQIGRDTLNRLLTIDSKLSGILLLASDFNTDGDELGIGFQPSNNLDIVKVGGGLAGSLPEDDGVFSQTWVLDENRRPVSGKICAVGFSGQQLVFRNSAKGGWKSLGPERIATSAEDHILREIDGRPALSLYKEYLGDRAKELPLVASHFPLASRAPTQGVADWAPAGVLHTDETTQSLRLTRKITEGSSVQMLRGYSAELFDAAEDAANDLNPISSDAHLALVTSCVGRRATLGSRTADELSSVREALSEHVSMVGFYGMGEFSTTESTACKLYNYTMTIVLIGEKSG